MSDSNKILSLEELGNKTAELKEAGKTVAHCHGVFDLLHPGHFKHFEAAAKLSNVLVVTVTSDGNVNKGPNRPIFTEAIRAEAIAAIGVVDYVAINDSPTAVPAIEALKPSLYVKGQDYKNADEDVTGGITDEQNAVEKHGGKLTFTDEIQFSSSKLINRHVATQNEETEGYLAMARDRFSYDGMKKLFDDVSKLNVLVVGDIILDEYQFVRPMGKASKSATITAKIDRKELYAGGVLAVANHIADFVNNVTLVAGYGINDGKDYSDFIKGHLHDRVKFDPLHTPERPTTLKRRFVDSVFKQKLFEVTEINDSPLEEEAHKALSAKLQHIEGQYSLVVVADFGHGLLDDAIVKELCEKDIFIALNTQTNSANKGYNLLTKYPRCNYFSIDQDEARLAAHNKFGDIYEIHQWLIGKMAVELSSITLGVNGCLVVNSEGMDKATAPVFNHDVVDTIGAGDAYLSITSLLAKQGATIDEIAFVGNAVGAMAVQILGNKSYIERSSLLKYIKTLLA